VSDQKTGGNFGSVVFTLSAIFGVVACWYVYGTGGRQALATFAGVYGLFMFAMYGSLKVKEASSEKSGITGRGTEAARPTVYQVDRPVIEKDNFETLADDFGDKTIRELIFEDPEELPDIIEEFVPPGKQVDVAGYNIPGPVYIGEGNGYGSNEGHLIDRRLIVKPVPDDCELGETNYWPSYSQISPEHRARFLAWHQAGRPATKDLGYFYIWLYGLERYATSKGQDAEKLENLQKIKAELKQNQAYYSEEIEKPHIAGLIDYINVRYFPGTPSIQLRYPETLPRQLLSSEHIKLAEYANDNQKRKLPYDLALIWLMSSGQVSRSKALKENFKELTFLFRHVYESITNGGIQVPKSKTKLEMHHQGFAGYVSMNDRKLDVPDGWCDPTTLSAPLKPVKEAYSQAVKDVKKFVKAREYGDSLYDLLSNLPDYVPVNGNKTLTKLQHELDCIEGKMTLLGDIRSLLGVRKDKKPAKAEIKSLTQALSRIGYTIIPDVSVSPVSMDDDTLVLPCKGKSLAETWSPAGKRFQALGMVCCKIDQPGGISDKQTGFIANLLDAHSNAEEREYLRKFIPWCVITSLPRLSLRPVTQDLEESELEALRLQFLKFYIDLGGRLDKGLVKKIESVLVAIGGDKQDVIQRLHLDGTGQQEAGKVEQRPTALPQTDTKPSAGDLVLNRDKIRTLKESTNSVQKSLSEALAEDTETHIEQAPAPEIESNNVSSGDGVWHAGHLDSDHGLLAVWLCGKNTWALSEVEAKCAELGLMVDGALDKINDAAFEVFEEALVEHGDPVEVYTDLLEAMDS
jgi:hypothetical protein